MEEDHIEGDSDGDVDISNVVRKVPKDIRNSGVKSGAVCLYIVHFLFLHCCI